MAGQIDRPLDDVRSEFAEAGRLPALRSDLVKSKALDWVSERANLVDEDGQQIDADALQLPTQDESAADAAPDDDSEDEAGEPVGENVADQPAETGEDET